MRVPNRLPLPALLVLVALSCLVIDLPFQVAWAPPVPKQRPHQMLRLPVLSVLPLLLRLARAA